MGIARPLPVPFSCYPALAMSTLFEHVAFSRLAAKNLKDRREPGLEAAARGPQVEAPDPHPIGAGEREGVVQPRVQARGPVSKRRGVIVGKSLDVLDHESLMLERTDDAREVKGLGIGKDVALRERPGRGICVPEARDPMIEEAPTRAQNPPETAAVGIDLGFADVLDHADARDRIESLPKRITVVGDPGRDLTLEPGVVDALARKPRL